MSDQTQSPPSALPPTWQEWKVQHRHWAWLLAPEWISEWLVYLSRSWDFVKVLELAGKFALLFSVVVGVWTYFAEADEREKARQDAIKAKHYRAWELINSARGSTGDGGRRDALQELSVDGVSLAGVYVPNAELSEIQLQHARLRGANFDGANLESADLTGAILVNASLKKAILTQVKLLDGANLSSSDLTGAHLNWIEAKGALMHRTILRCAYLRQAKLQDAYLLQADLKWSNLTEANLQNADISEAMLEGVKFCRTTMPDGSLNIQNCDQPESNCPE
jgi:uncharacterized protein YjbI with pentapeptide repeats